MEDILSFRTMITPTIIRVLFVLVAGLFILIGLMRLAQGEGLQGIGIIILGPLLTRVYCELMILFFRMNETLTEISRSIGGTPPSSSTTWVRPLAAPTDQTAKPGWMSNPAR